MAIVLNNITSGYNLSKINANFQNIEDYINDKLLARADTGVAGEAMMERALDMNGNKILNVFVDINDPDSLLTLSVADSRYYNVSGDTLTGPMDANSQSINNLPSPVQPSQPATKAYADAIQADVDSNERRSLRFPDVVEIMADVSARANSLQGYNDAGKPVPVFSMTSTADLALQLASSNGSSLVGFKNSGASAVTRTLQSRLRDVFNARDYGIIGDGVTDDSAAAQALVDYVSSLGGGCIYWPKGVYKLNFINKANVCHVGCTFGAVRGVISYGAAITKYATQFTPATAGWIIDTPVGGGDCGGIIGIDFKGGGLTTAGGGVNLRTGSYDWIVTACKWDYFADEALVTNGLIGRFSDLSGTNCLLNRTRSARTGVFVFNGADNFIERIQGNTGITAIQSSDLYLCGIVIGGANNYAVNLEGELSEIGVSVTATGAMHKLTNCRADLNYGHGFYGSAIMSNCHALNNSNGNSGVYSGFVMNNRSQLSNCRADGTHKYGLDWISSADQAGLELKPRVAAFHSTGHVTAAIADTLFNGFLHTMYKGFQRGTGSTPNVEGVETYIPTDTVATDITDLLGGVKGQRVVIFGNPNITLVRSSTFIVKGCTSDGRKTMRLGGTYEFWRGNGIWYEVGAQTPAVGTTALRPSAFSWPGDQYFDTTLNKPIWRNAAGNGWVDATGTAV